jgi:hypothetical protein
MDPQALARLGAVWFLRRQTPARWSI